MYASYSTAEHFTIPITQLTNQPTPTSPPPYIQKYLAKQVLKDEEVPELMERAEACLRAFRKGIRVGDLVDVFEVHVSVCVYVLYLDEAIPLRGWDMHACTLSVRFIVNP